MKRYVLGIVLDYNMNYALMIHRDKNPYAGCLNGIGGKIEEGESPICAMIRELEEETGIMDVEIDVIKYLMTIYYSSDIELNVFYIILPKSFEKLDFVSTDEGIIYWYDINDANLLDVTNHGLAGDGNIPYFIEYAIETENWRRYNEQTNT